MEDNRSQKDKKKGPSKKTIQALFSRVVEGYDLANDLITLGRIRAWRRRLVEKSGVKNQDLVLDIATGTGDLAYEFYKKRASVRGADFCEKMLEKAKKKYPKLSFEYADLMNLKYEDNFFHISSVAYGLRNVEDLERALKELARVTRSSGKVLILETGNKPSFYIKPFFHFHMCYLVPLIGSFVSKDKLAYEYLQTSSFQFPAREEFVKLIKETGCFASVNYEVFMGGASFLYCAEVI